MLEIRELYKVYKPKKGVPVTAINKVSLKFPDKGMVFLLGKSGSGKSTLLNLLGGLDKYDGGEIIIKGVSSKDFNQQRFDSYRNTYVGFIFQEYNILEEFSVGANIALALELQGKKATDEEINNILKEVDLEGFGNRKPNELSGGQKQRVAIARALVKNPEIIMADEPTGALDSNTGKQVFDTLKKLSRKKLVIIVSHDREFSEKYADRIIELADGQVISDVELDSAYSAADFAESGFENVADIVPTERNLVFKGNTIELSSGYHLTEEDRIAINNYIADLKSGKVQIKVSEEQTEGSRRFVPTNQDNIYTNSNKEEFKLIKSKLPLKNAFKIGASGLKYKKFRLVMTIFLSFVAFTLFGLADTLGSYDHIKACTNSLVDNNVKHLSLAKAIKETGGFEEDYYTDYGNYMSKEDLAEIEKLLGIDFTGAYSNGEHMMNDNLGSDKLTESGNDLYITSFSGFAEVNNELLDKMNHKLVAGKLPDGIKDEIAVSLHCFETFKLGKYVDGSFDEKGEVIQTEIKSYEDLIGKEIKLNGIKYTITGIIDTNFNFDRYKELTTKEDYLTNAEQLARYALMSEFTYEVFYSLTGVVMTGEGFIDRYVEMFPKTYKVNDGYLYYYTEDGGTDICNITLFDKLDKSDIIWIDGERDTLGDNELIITSDILMNFNVDINIDDKGNFIFNDNVKKQIKELSITGNYYSYYDDVDEYYNNVKIVGIIPVSLHEEGVKKYPRCTVIPNNRIVNMCVSDTNGIYEFVVGPMPEGRDEILDVVKKTAGSTADIKYTIQSSVTYDLELLNSLIKTIAKVAIYVGIFFAIFASLMLANFIGISISHKKQEIGILRAIGARSKDVFTIFFSESFIIATINFILAAVATSVLTDAINQIINDEMGLLITVLDFGARQIILLLGVSIAVATVACFIPVMKIASKKPIDAIRKR